MEPLFYKTNSLVGKKFREYFLPSLLGAMAGQLGIVVDSLMVGNLVSSNAMTGVSVCMPLEQIIGAISLMLSVGAAGMIAVASGARKRDEANRIYSAVIIVNVLASIVILAATVPFLPQVSHALAGQEEIAPLTQEYLDIMIWRTPFMMLFYAAGILVGADGMAKLASQGTLISQIVNIAMDSLLIGGLNMGLRGAAIATVASDVAGLLYIFLRYIRADRRMLKFLGLSCFRKGFGKLTGELVKTGFPAAAASGLVSLKVWAIYRILESAGGTDAMQIYSVCMYILVFLSMVVQGSQQAMLPILGVIFGEKDYKGVRMLLKYVMKFSYILAAIFLVLIMLFPTTVLTMFNLPPELAAEGAVSVRLFCLSLPGVLFTFMMVYYYTVIGKTMAANLLSVIEGILVVIPAAWLLVKIMGTTGVWIAFIVTEVITVGVLLIYVRIMHKKDPEQNPDIYLIPKTLQELLYDVSVKADRESAAALSKDTIETLEKSGIDSEIATRAGVAMEEITLNLAANEQKKKRDMDVRIVRNDEHVIISLRDNGTPFNPMEYSVDEEDYQTYGIMMFKAVTTDIQYSLVLSLNQTIIEI